MVPVTKSKYRHLPDLCLLALFGQMPLKDRLSAHKVNSRWGQLVREASRPVNSLTVVVTNRKLSEINIEDHINSDEIGTFSSVKLLKKEDGCTPLFPIHRITKWNCLQFRGGTLDSTKVQQIVNIFFATTEFAFVIDNSKLNNEKKFGLLVEMLQDQRWRHQLTTFKLFDLQNSYSKNNVVDAINALSALRHLTLNLYGIILKDLPILAQLKEIHFDNFSVRENRVYLVRSLNRYATNNHGLRVYTNAENMLYYLDNLNAQLWDRIARLSFSPLTGSLLSSCNHFRSLTSLSLRNVAPSVQIFTDLSQLHQLVHLQLDLNFNNFPTNFNESVRPVTQLTSVKALDLGLTITSHSQLQWLSNFPWTVPNVQAIYLKSFECKSCGNKAWLNYSNASELHQCLCSAFQVLKQTGVPLSQILYYRPFNDIGTAEELLLSLEV